MLHLDVFLSAQTSGTSTHSTSERRRKLCLSGQWSEVQLQVQVSSTMVALTPTTNNPSSPCLASLPAVCNTVILSKLGTLQDGNRAFSSISAFSVRFWWINRTKSARLVTLALSLLPTTKSEFPNNFFCKVTMAFRIVRHS